MCNQTPNFCHWLRCDSCPPTTRPRYARHLKRRLEILMYDMIRGLFDRDDTVTVTVHLELFDRDDTVTVTVHLRGPDTLQSSL